jgi:hypothetical protein
VKEGQAYFIENGLKIGVNEYQSVSSTLVVKADLSKPLTVQQKTPMEKALNKILIKNLVKIMPQDKTLDDEIQVEQLMKVETNENDKH